MTAATGKEQRADLLAADIGGTKTDIALYARDRGIHDPLVSERFVNARYASFSDLLDEFLSRQLGELAPAVRRACIGVAGPVEENRATLTNLAWEIDGEELASRWSMSGVTVINDLVALASSLPHLGTNDLLPLHGGKPKEHGAMAVVAPGTGLGMASLVWCGERYLACPSEGGHAAYAPHPDDRDLAVYLFERGEQPCLETLASGSGLAVIYTFLRDSGLFPEPYFLAARFAEASDPTPVIVEAALARQPVCHICRETVRLFWGIVADVCRHLALTHVARGGLFIGGGIAPRIVPLLDQSAFPRRFRQGGKMAPLLADIPLFLIVREKAALLGAAAYALEEKQPA